MQDHGTLRVSRQAEFGIGALRRKVLKEFAKLDRSFGRGDDTAEKVTTVSCLHTVPKPITYYSGAVL